MNFAHTSVLLTEVIEGLNIRPDGIYLDGTLGGAGHSLEIVKRLSEKGRHIGIDQDEDAIAAAKKRLSGYENVTTIVRDNYCNFSRIMDEVGVEQVDGILLDLGVSSFQLDEAQRGFSYRNEAPLDMRMDRRNELSAYDVVNGYSEAELARVIYQYGEERYSRNIARKIVNARSQEPIKTTTELSDLICSAIPAKSRRGKHHPAKRTFQAIRIEVNGELTVLSDTLDAMIDRLSDGGRICVITFHSLEDRIVKQKFKVNENPCICPPDFPICVCGRISKGNVITGRPIIPTAQEQTENPRSASAKLRIFERRRAK